MLGVAYTRGPGASGAPIRRGPTSRAGTRDVPQVSRAGTRDAPATPWQRVHCVNTLLADSILVVHFAFVLFVVGGFALIVAGAALGWRWIRNRAFRYAHLAAITFVAAEAIAGVTCPLTVWEDLLRRARPDSPSFVARWVSRLLYYDLPEWVFTTSYVVFAIAVAVTLWLAPPHRAPARNKLSS